MAEFNPILGKSLALAVASAVADAELVKGQVEQELGPHKVSAQPELGADSRKAIGPEKWRPYGTGASLAEVESEPADTHKDEWNYNLGCRFPYEPSR